MATARTVPGLQDRRLFAATVRRLGPLEDSSLHAVFSLMRVRELRRGEYFLRAGERASEVTLVARGLLREHFVLPDGSERTKAFVAEGELSGSWADLLADGPSRAFIVADEGVRLLCAPFAAWRDVAARDPAWARYEHAALQALFLRKAEREYELLGLDAAARYAAFAVRYPALEARVAARHVASYLGITPVHLSRLRRRGRERAGAAD
jgi:CRP-like cAMP-binding protein